MCLHITLKFLSSSQFHICLTHLLPLPILQLLFLFFFLFYAKHCTQTKTAPWYAGGGCSTKRGLTQFLRFYTTRKYLDTPTLSTRRRCLLIVSNFCVDSLLTPPTFSFSLSFPYTYDFLFFGAVAVLYVSVAIWCWQTRVAVRSSISISLMCWFYLLEAPTVEAVPSTPYHLDNPRLVWSWETPHTTSTSTF